MNVIILYLGIGAAEIFSLLLSIGIFILIFLALRVFFLWYWKVNIIIKNQEKQIDLLSTLVQERERDVKASEISEKPGNMTK